jgi:hypothetical protein
VKTTINRAAWEDAEARADLRRLIPSGRIGEVEDIASAVARPIPELAPVTSATWRRRVWSSLAMWCYLGLRSGTQRRMPPVDPVPATTRR